MLQPLPLLLYSPLKRWRTCRDLRSYDLRKVSRIAKNSAEVARIGQEFLKQQALWVSFIFVCFKRTVKVVSFLIHLTIRFLDIFGRVIFNDT